MNAKRSPFAPASGPDIAARLRQAVEANETTRIVLTEGLANLAQALNAHLQQVDTHLNAMIEDIEGRTQRNGH